MSKLSKDLEAIKSEFQNDEKLLENAFKLERFFKKYKFVLIGIVAVCVVWVGAVVLSDYIDEKNAQETTQIYNQLLASPQNTILRENLAKKAPNLYDAFIYANLAQEKEARLQELENLTISKNELIAQMASYELASLKGDKELLNSISKPSSNKKDSSNALQDFAKIQEAYLLLKENDITKAREVLKGVSSDSSLDSIARQMEHFGIDKIQAQSLKLESVKITEPSSNSTKTSQETNGDLSKDQSQQNQAKEANESKENLAQQKGNQ